MEPAYAEVEHRSARGGKWVIPWAEDDPHLGASQLWVNRTLQHMEAAQAMAVDGALLITWRMEAVAPTIWALAHKGWNASLSATDAWAGWAAGELERFVGRLVYVRLAHADTMASLQVGSLNVPAAAVRRRHPRPLADTHKCAHKQCAQCTQHTV